MQNDKFYDTVYRKCILKINFMQTNTNTKKPIGLILGGIWVANCILAIAIAFYYNWLPFMNAAPKPYANISADAFDGTSMPITHIPDWSKAETRDKSLDFRNIPTNKIIPIPRYDINGLQNVNNLMARFTYTVAYMGSYTLNYKENDGSHLGVDIRAPIGTPVLSIANGVVVRTVEADSSGNKFVVIRHDNVPVNGKTQDLYSSYLHLSEISVREGTKIAKGEMLGRVGITGITTTPHLHFQIDTADAPFHPYWPFTSAEARAAGMNIFQGVTAGLGSQKALAYTIHPMNFVQNYLSGNTEKNFNDNNNIEIPMKSLEEIVNFKEVESSPALKNLEDLVTFTAAPETPKAEEKIIVASAITYNTESCEKNLDSYEEKFAKFQNATCGFDHISKISANKNLTRAEALTMLMKFYKESPESGISHFLDINLADEILQGYAVKAYQKGIFKGEYLYPNKTISRAEFIEVLSRFGFLNEAPANYRAYSDVGPNSSLFKSVNNYGYTIGVKNVKLSPNAPITQTEAVNFLNYLMR